MAQLRRFIGRLEARARWIGAVMGWLQAFVAAFVASIEVAPP
jgi:hypothetical protein